MFTITEDMRAAIVDSANRAGVDSETVLASAQHGLNNKGLAVCNALVEQIDELLADEFGDDDGLNLSDFAALYLTPGASFDEIYMALKEHLVALRREVDYMAREQLTERELLALL